MAPAITPLSEASRRSDREAGGFVVWIEGLPGSGKSTIATLVAARLESAHTASEILDGEKVRHAFFPELGYSRKDRETHARRVSLLAKMLARQGAGVVVAMITPYETSRQAARAVFGSRFLEVWLRCPVEVCETREGMGLYRKGHAGSLTKVTGLDDPFEEPLNPDLVLETDRTSAEACSERVLAQLATAGFLPSASA